MDLSNDSCSRTRSGLVRRKDFMSPSDDSCSRTRSGLVRRKSFTESSDASCSRTRSGLVRRKGGSPPVKALIMDGPVKKELPGADGHLTEETPSRTRSGLVRQSPTVKRETPVATRSGLARGNPAIKALREDEPVIKGLADGWLKEDKPPGIQTGHVRGTHAAKALTKVTSVTKEQHVGCLREDKPLDEAQSGIAQGSKAVKTLDKDRSATKGLPDGWWKEYRPRKPGSSQQNDTYYIDPVSGYEFRSMKDVHRYLQAGDIGYCVVKPKKRTMYDICVTESQTHTSPSPQQIKPATADKAIQCEILTSEGIMLPWEEDYILPHKGRNTEHTMSPESESMRAMDKYDHRLETLQQDGTQPFTAQCAPRQTESIERQGQNVEVKSKKRRSEASIKRQGQNVEVKSKKRRSEASPAVTPIRVSCRLAAMNAQSKAIIEPDDEPISTDLVNQLQTVEVNINDQPVTSQSSTMNKIHGNDERTYNQLWSSQEVTVKRIQTLQENTTNHLQLSQVDAVNCIQMNQENTDHQLAETMNHKQTNVENTFNQLQSDLADTLNHIELIQEDTAPMLQSTLEDTVLPTQMLLQYTTARQEDTMNHIQMKQENIANKLQSSMADTIVTIHSTQGFTNDHSQPNHADSMKQIQMIQNNMNNLSQPNQANSLNQIDINLENTTNHLGSNYVENALLQTGFSWAPEQNGGSGAHVTDFWRSIENQDSSVPMQIDGVPVASFPTNVKFQSMSATAAAEPTTKATVPATVSNQSGLVSSSLFGDVWADPCIEFAFKTLTGDIPILDDTAAVTDYFPQQQDLNKSTTPNCSTSSLDNSKTHTQVDINLQLPRPSDKLSNGSWFPPQ